MAIAPVRLRLAAFLVLALVALPQFTGWHAARGAPRSAPAIEEVRRAFAQCREVQKQATPVEVYQRRSGKPAAWRWQREKPPADSRAGRTMRLFTVDGTVRMALEEVYPPSGDWQQTVDRCFRSDGSLAFVLAVLRTFQGNVQVEDRLYFDPAGERIRMLRRISDLTTKKPLKPEEASFMSQEPRLYRRSDELLKAIGPELVFPPHIPK